MSRRFKACPAPVVLLAIGFAAAVAGCRSTSTNQAIRSAESAPDVRLRVRAEPEDEQTSETLAVAAPSDAKIAEGITLGEAETAALRHHPRLIEAAHRVRALAALARAEGNLPAPELMAELWQVPLAHPAQLGQANMIMVSLRQEIPAPGSLDLAAEATALEAQAEAVMVAAQARSLLREVDRGFADYVEAMARHKLHLEHQALVARMQSAARARYGTGAALGDVTKADLEAARLDADIAREAGMVADARAKLNGLMARPSEAGLGPPQDVEPETAKLAPKELADRAAANNPEVLAATLSSQAADTSAHAADRTATWPSFNVGLGVFPSVRDTPVGYGASFGMSLPWLWGAASNRTESREHSALAARAAVDNARLDVRTEVAKAIAVVESSERRFTLLRDRTRPAVRRALDAMQSGYAAGGTDLLSWLDAERSSLDVEVEITAARGDLARGLADLDWAVGQRVSRVSLPAPKEASHVQ